jgi:hypothetical protein
MAQKRSPHTLCKLWAPFLTTCDPNAVTTTDVSSKGWDLMQWAIDIETNDAEEGVLTEYQKISIVSVRDALLDS